MKKLWQPVSLGRLSLVNRLVMAPMTRSRSTPSGTPTELNAIYYAQRATVGLIVAEGTQPSSDGQGYNLTPGIYTEEHIAGWKVITDRVHAAGGRIFIQLMHVGRIAHPDNRSHRRAPVAPSEVRPAGTMFTPNGPQDFPMPRALGREEIGETIRDFRHAARSAIRAGADGIELHGANGYLIHQFLSENANRRTDEYGGTIGNRVRFAVEVAEAVADEIGPERVGLRISPHVSFNDIVEGDTVTLYRALIEKLAMLRLAYLHVVHVGDDSHLHAIRGRWPAALIVNRPGRTREEIANDVESGVADLASVGSLALANPDLVARLQSGAMLNSRTGRPSTEAWRAATRTTQRSRRSSRHDALLDPVDIEQALGVEPDAFLLHVGVCIAQRGDHQRPLLAVDGHMVRHAVDLAGGTIAAQ
jgi:N-ethylmaleimide reductase